MRLLAVLLFLFAVVSHSDAKPPRGPSNVFYVQPSVGEPWPKPQSVQTTAQQFAIHPAVFHFLVNSTSQTCDLLTSALDRYYRLIFFPQTYLNYILNPGSVNNQTEYTPKINLAGLRAPLLERLNVYIQQPCDQYPSLESNESCKRN
jgi:hypothetical protein